MYAMFVLLPLAVEHPVLVLPLERDRPDDLGRARQLRDRPRRTPTCSGRIFNAFKLVVFFSFIPVALGLVVASVGASAWRTGRLGAAARTVLFLPQVIPLVAAGIIWGWLLALPGLINQILTAHRPRRRSPVPGSATSTGRSRPSASSGSGCCSGFCTVLLLTGMTKIDPALYESARIDGAGWFTEFRRDHRPASPARDRRLPHRDGDRRARRIRHRLRLDGRRTRQLDGGPRNPDLHPRVHRAAASAWHPRWPSCSWSWSWSSSSPSSA